jgi:hypothetical protein
MPMLPTTCALLSGGMVKAPEVFGLTAKIAIKSPTLNLTSGFPCGAKMAELSFLNGSPKKLDVIYGR